MQKADFKIPEEVKHVTNTLEESGFEAYLVGGCVRDLLLDRKPKDWDITTNATPEQIQNLFKEDETFYENNFGTVGVKIAKIYENNQQNLTNSDFDDDGVIEVTPYRTEGVYKDARRPEQVQFTDSLTDDLKRRDFTVNAMAYRIKTGELVDVYDGQNDINHKLLRAVGEANERFAEDALRMMRALRFSAQLDFAIEQDTMLAIAQNKDLLQKISKERIREEFEKIIMTPSPAQALAIAEQLGLLEYIIPELREGIGCEQGKKAHKYDVFEHLLRSLNHAAAKNLTLEERLAALFHDIGKPRSRRKKGSGYTFYGHEVVGARMTQEIMERLHFSKKMIDTVTKLVRWHMFFSDPDVVTLSAVRRIINNVGKENIRKLLDVRMCDRIGSGRPKEQPFRLRKYQSMVDEALRDPITVGMLKIDGSYIMKEFDEKPGPRIGWVLHALLEEVLNEPQNNNIEFLHKKTEELLKLDNIQLQELGRSGAEKQKEADDAKIKQLRAKYHVS